MKKLYTLLFISFTTFVLAQNIVVNPTFANGLNSWTATGTNYALPTLITNNGQDDSSSVQYVATATTGFDQRFNVVPGSTVTVSFWYKAARTNGAATGNTARIWSTFTDPTSATPTTPINPPGTTGATDDPLRNSNTYLAQATAWTQVTVNSVVPTGATVFQLQLRAYNGATVSFDNISFSSTGASVLSSSSFNAIENLKIFVNNNNLFVTSNSTDDKQVSVYNMQGKEVVNSVSTESGINVSDLASGIYIVKVTENGISESRKIAIK